MARAVLEVFLWCREQLPALPGLCRAQGMSTREPAPSPFWQPSTKPPARLQGSWDSLVANAGERVIAPYDRARSYQVGALVDHPRYHVGVAVELPAPGKVLLRFQDRDRTLVAGCDGP